MRAPFLAVAMLATFAAAAQSQMPVAPPPPPVGQAANDIQNRTVYRLRNVAAADVARALSEYWGRQKEDVKIEHDAISNSIFVFAEPAQQSEVGKQIRELDWQPPQLLLKSLVINSPVGFPGDIGLAEGDEATWILTPRETRMFGATLRRNRGIEILSRPSLQMADTGKGVIQVGDDARSVTVSVTPRLSPEGKAATLQLQVSLRQASPVPIQIGNGATATAYTTQTIAATESIPLGGTLLVRGPRCSADGGKGELRDVLILMTVYEVKSRAASGP